MLTNEKFGLKQMKSEKYYEPIFKERESISTQSKMVIKVAIIQKLI